MASIFDVFRVPRNPTRADLIKAEEEMAAFVQDTTRKAEEQRKQQEDMWAKQVIDQSVERRVRESLESVMNANPMALNLDPLDMSVSMPVETFGNMFPGSYGFITYDTLLQMANTPIFATIIDRRLKQMRPFTRRQRNGADAAFRVRMRDHRRSPTPAAERRMLELEAFVETCGDPTRKMTFTKCTDMMMRDSLTYDQACSEKLKDAYGRPAAVIPVDSRTIRLATPPQEQVDRGYYNPQKRGYIQVLNSQKVQEWEHEEMIFGIRNQVTDIRRNGYGYPELEQINRIVTYLLNAEFYNASNFSNGIHVSALLVAKSSMDRGQFQQLKAQLKQSMVGSQNAHKMAMLQMDPSKGEDLEIRELSRTNKDMEFSRWMDFLIKVGCARFNMDPAELNFIYGAEGQTHSFQNEDPKDRIAFSREQGLTPLVLDYFSWWNQEVIWQLDPDFELEPVGLDQKATLNEVQIAAQRVQTTTSINEERARMDLKPLGQEDEKNGWVFNVPLSALVVNTIAQSKANEQAAMQAEGPQNPQNPDDPEDQMGGQQPEDLPEELPETALGEPEYEDLPDIDLANADDATVDELLSRRSDLPPGTKVTDLFKGSKPDGMLIEVRIE